MSPPPPPPPPPPPRSGALGRLLRWEWAAALAALVLYARVVGFGWVYDDQMEVVLNTFVASLASVPRIFTTTAWTGSGMETFLYRPLSILTYALNHQVSGTEPWSYHAVNVLLHAGAAVLVVRLGLAWGLSGAAAGVAGLLFAVHPVHVEAVVPVFGRKDLLATVALLGMLLTHRRALARGGGSRVAAPLLYLAAMLSKEVGVVGVALVVVQDLLLERDRRAFLAQARVPLLYASYLLAAALYLLARAQVTGGLGIPDTSFFDNPLVSAPPGSRLATAWVVVAQGVALLVLPLRQSPDYSFDALPLVASAGDPRFLAALVGGLLLVGLLALPRVRRTSLPLAVAWYALALLPTANLLVLSGTIFAERLLYLPSVAFCLAVGMGAGRGVARRPSVGWALVGLVVTGYSVKTASYASVWSDDVSLFRHAAAAVPTSTKAHHKLGEELLRRGDLGDALRALHRALEIAPDNVWAAQTLGVARSHVAARYLPEAPGITTFPDDPEELYALGAVALERGDTATAMAATEGAVARDPALARAWLMLAAVRNARGDLPGTEDALRRFLATAGGRYPTEEAQARSYLSGLQER